MAAGKISYRPEHQLRHEIAMHIRAQPQQASDSIHDLGAIDMYLNAFTNASAVANSN